MEGRQEIAGTGLVTIAQLAEHLQLSVGTIYYWVHRREIPYMKIGKHLRFNLNEVMGYFGTATKDRAGRGCLSLRERVSHPQNSSLTTRDVDHAELRRKE